MSSPVSAKRRKLKEAAHTLSKPFVSPLRSAKADRKPLRENNVAGNVPYVPSTLAHTVKADYDATAKTIDASKSASKPTLLAPVPKQRCSTISIKRPDAAEIAAQRALTSLELQIRALKNDLDVFAQAQHITTSTTDAELEVLTERWRLASQQAAEEIFGTVKERVYRMGGVAAWRESEKRKFERANGLGEFALEEEPVDNDADCEFDSQGEELPEEEALSRKKEKRRLRQEVMDAADLPEKPKMDTGGGVSKVWQEGDKDDDVGVGMSIIRHDC
ncbi:hypothetical protein BAUCODRAFT_31237 [Baudoinia panamericana UAMH 10762]|uniref:DNA repair protein Dds20/Mei5 n=1 Tax=Baudoinia panamericana (strain UAMH 10762) TaxID=717646 RepID=M2NIP5_BAUPA|nr:uncharacterized protein BAUCODRAFT_31237 [Baudoinia panamericana UAMH 10762]EMC98965.1 hypothetical protein BAUCODRAFT_31237 [Baudoinia panamericana UAMH 10762]